MKRTFPGFELSFLEIKFHLCVGVDHPIDRVLVFCKILDKPLPLVTGRRGVKMPNVVRILFDGFKVKKMGKQFFKIFGKVFHTKKRYQFPKPTRFLFSGSFSVSSFFIESNLLISP